jgi:hypothetical protein
VSRARRRGAAGVVPELLKLTRGGQIVPVIVEEGRIQIAPAGGAPL